MEANGFEFIFIGLNNLGTEKNWVWSSGKPTSYTHWDKEQPDNHQGDLGWDQGCVALKTTERWKGYWDDYWCNDSRPFFCQMDLFE